MQSRFAVPLSSEDQATIRRWARALGAVYSFGLVALVAFSLVSHHFAGGRVKTADSVQAAVDMTQKARPARP